MKFYLPDGTPTERPYGEDPVWGLADDGYTSNPTHLRIWQDETGDEWTWHIDGANSEGRYTEDVRRFVTEQEAIDMIAEFVQENFRKEEG